VVVMGTVTSISATNITVKSSEGGTKSYIITSSTSLDKGSQGKTTYRDGEIKAGDSLGLVLESDGKTVSSIMANLHSEYQPGN
jgi:hypothetical protein